MENSVTTALRLINKTVNFDGLSCVIMQDNLASDSEPGIAWHVVSNLAHGETYAFDYVDMVQVNAIDAHGYTSPPSGLLDAKHGTMFKLEQTGTLVNLFQINNDLDPTGIDMLNAVESGSYNFCCYRAGHKVAEKFDIPPGVMARFEFKPVLVIGIVSQGDVTQGKEIHPVILSHLTTHLTIEGLAFANIVMTGGGIGPNSKPITFTLENMIPKAT